MFYILVKRGDIALRKRFNRSLWIFRIFFQTFWILGYFFLRQSIKARGNVCTLFQKLRGKISPVSSLLKGKQIIFPSKEILLFKCKLQDICVTMTNSVGKIAIC